MKNLFLTLALCLFLTPLAHAEEPRVRNLIYLIGDGMGLAHVSMMMIEEGYAPTVFDRAQGVALISTYSANNRVTDSAAAGTALATGGKTNNGTIGQSPSGEHYESIMARAIAQGMTTGIAVTCHLQHATPAAFYAHTASRYDTLQVTSYLLDSGIDVLMGGGRRWIDRSRAEQFSQRGYRVVNSLEAADTLRSGRLLCLMARKHMEPAPERGDYLPRATARALEILSNNAAERGTGLMLMVEGSLIDYAAHDNDAPWLLAEMRDFAQAVAVAMDFADRTPGTLVVVAADHETGGLSIPANDEDFTREESGIRYHFSTKSHTGSLVPVFLYGEGASELSGVMDNTVLGRRLMALCGLE